MIDDTRRLGAGRKALFGAGDLTTALPLTLLNFFQVYFLTDIARIPPAMAAWSILAVKLWDAIDDPVIGVVSDRITTRWGRRRGPMILAAVPLGLSFAALWIVPSLPPTATAVLYTAAFILFDTCFTVFHVSFNSLTPALAPTYDERSSLNGYRMVFSIAGSLVAVIVMTLLAGVIPDARTRYAVAGAGFGLVAMVPPFLAFIATAGVDRPEPRPEPASEASPAARAAASLAERAEAKAAMRKETAASIRAVMGNRGFRLVMGLYLCSWTTTAIISAALVYFVNYYLREPGHANYIVLAAEIAAIAFIPLVVAFARKRDKRTAFIAGCVSWMAVQAAVALLPPDALVPAYVLAALSGLGIATAYVVPWSMIPDVIERDELESGKRREGAYYSFASFFQKLGTGIALWAMTRMMEVGGYVTPTDAVPYPDQPTGAVTAIRLFMGVAPAVLLAAAVAFARLYAYGRADQLATREALLARVD